MSEQVASLTLNLARVFVREKGVKDLPCWTITHTKHKCDNHQKFIEIFQNDEHNLEDITPTIRTVFWNCQRVGENIERQVDIGL